MSGKRTTEWKLALGCVAAGVVLACGGIYLLATGTGLGVGAVIAGAVLSAGASVGYSHSRATVKANQAATYRHRQL